VGKYPKTSKGRVLKYLGKGISVGRSQGGGRRSFLGKEATAAKAEAEYYLSCHKPERIIIEGQKKRACWKRKVEKTEGRKVHLKPNKGGKHPSRDSNQEINQDSGDGEHRKNTQPVQQEKKKRNHTTVQKGRQSQVEKESKSFMGATQ